jgi:hypothetical protein
MASYHPILQCDLGGVPHAWIDYQRYAYYATKGNIAWEIGTDSYTLHGGVQRLTGLQSTMPVSTIVAVAGEGFAARKKQIRPPLLSSRTLYQRDMKMCAYCGYEFAMTQLTRDHIVPQCQNGDSTWMNVVTCCKRCNREKGGRTPEQACMPLLYVPYTPNQQEYLILQQSGRILEDQMEYLKQFIREERRDRYMC